MIEKGNMKLKPTAPGNISSKISIFIVCLKINLLSGTNRWVNTIACGPDVMPQLQKANILFERKRKNENHKT